MNMEVKFFGGKILELKQEERNGVQVGIIAGYIATWDIDRGSFGVRDQFVRGAFIESLRQHQVNKRMVRLKDHHRRTVGGFPIEHVREDEVGLYAIGEINLEVQQGKEMMALLRQGALSDFSIGFSVIEFTEDEGLRRITKANIFEGSVVDEPMNPKAVITDVKSFQDLPLADKDYVPVGELKACLWGDKLPIAELIDGKLTVIPSAVIEAAEFVKSGGVQDAGEMSTVIGHIERYFAKMNMPSIFDDADRQYFTENDVKDMTTRQIEKALRATGSFSKSAAKILAGISTEIRLETVIDNLEPISNNNHENLMDELASLKKSFES